MIESKIDKEIIGITGKYRINKIDSKTGSILSQSEWFSNLVVSSNTYGRNLIGRQMIGDTTYPIVLDSMTLSTDNTTPTTADTSLGGTEIATVLDLLTITSSGQANIITFSGFYTDVGLPNDTYYKIGIKMGGRLFTATLLAGEIVKDTGEEFRIDYQITLN